MRKIFSIFILINFVLISCGPSAQALATQTADASTSIIAIWTATPTPTTSSTPTPSPTPTITMTPSPSPTPTSTPIAGGGKILTFCYKYNTDNGGIYEYDLKNKLFSLLVEYDNGANNYYISSISLPLIALGANKEFLDSIEILEDKHPLIVSNDGNSALTFQSMVFKIYWASLSKPQWKEIITIENTHPMNMTQNWFSRQSNRFAMVDTDFGGTSWIYIVQMGTGKVTKISQVDAIPATLRWSPDGTKLVYTSSNSNGNGGIWIIETETNLTTLINKDGRNANWSADSNNLIFQASDGIYTMDWEGKNIEPVTALNQPEIGRIGKVEWAPDGQKILFRISKTKNNLDWTNDFVAYEPDSNSFITYLKDIPVASGDYSGFYWSPDGRWFIGSVEVKSLRGVQGGLTSQNYLCSLDEESCTPLDLTYTPEDTNSYCNNSTWYEAGIIPSSNIPVQKTVVPIWGFEFERNLEGWEAWNQIANLKVIGGNLTGQTIGDDPYMGSPMFEIDAMDFHTINIRMSVSSELDAQLFFITSSDSTYDESKSLFFKIDGDGEFHTYSLDMSKIAGWSGTITQIRIDPPQRSSPFMIDKISID